MAPLGTSQQTEPAVPRPRIEGLSDLIFGLALSIGAIQLVTNTTIKSNGQVIAVIGAFGFSFLILISIWNRYTTVASTLPVETTLIIRLNMLLLFLVAIEPYLFNLLVINGLVTSNTLAEHVSEYFALDIAGMNFVLGYFTHILTIEEKKLLPAEFIGRFKTNRNALIGVASIFAISAIPLPIFWSFAIGTIPLRVLLWIISTPFIWITRIWGRKKAR
jgi:uncharacterized membrane protein